MRCSGRMVIGSTIMPDSLRLTLSISPACAAADMFLWMMPMPPFWAMQIAASCSVTVSIAADRSGVFSEISRVTWVLRSTSPGSTSEEPGSSRTSSKVSASRMRGSGRGRCGPSSSAMGEGAPRPGCGWRRPCAGCPHLRTVSGDFGYSSRPETMRRARLHGRAEDNGRPIPGQAIRTVGPLRGAPTLRRRRGGRVRGAPDRRDRAPWPRPGGRRWPDGRPAGGATTRAAAARARRAPRRTPSPPAAPR